MDEDFLVKKLWFIFIYLKSPIKSVSFQRDEGLAIGGGSAI